MIKFSFAICCLLLLAVGCNEPGTKVSLNNKSGQDFDSVRVTINNKVLHLGKLTDKGKVEGMLLVDPIKADHEVTFSLEAFTKDAVTMTGSIFSNSLESVPTEFRLTITDSLTLVPDVD